MLSCPNLKTTVLSLVILSLTACGFHLRGNAQIPGWLNPVYLEAGELNEDQLALIKRSLNRASAELSDFPAAANRLFIRFEAGEIQKLAESSLADIERIRLTMSLYYRISNPLGEWLIEDRQITQSEELELDSTNVLSHEGLISKSRQALQQGLLRTMIFQLTYL